MESRSAEPTAIIRKLRETSGLGVLNLLHVLCINHSRIFLNSQIQEILFMETNAEVLFFSNLCISENNIRKL